MIDRFIVISVE